MSDLTFIDLFSGCGGLALGFTLAGFKSVWAVEHDKDAAATYEANFGHPVFTGDIEDVDVIPPIAQGVALIVGGPPCQGFSPLGRFSPRPAHAKMNQLWREYLRVVEMVAPRAFIVENVPEFLGSEEGHKMILSANRLGYEVVSGILKAEEFGIPQKRRRGFIVGCKAGQPTLPSGNGIRRTVRDAISDLSLVPDERDWHVGRNPRPQSVERYKSVPPGGNRFDLVASRPDLAPRCWLDKPTGSTDVFGRLEWDKPSLTIRTEFYKPEKGRYLHPEAHRPITHREAMRLQTFPDRFVWIGSKISVARQVGNAVPPELALQVALKVKHILDENAETA